MKKIPLLMTCAALAWSLQACNNSNRNDNMDDSDSLYQDNIDVAPMDTTGMGTDTMDMDTSSINTP